MRKSMFVAAAFLAPMVAQAVTFPSPPLYPSFNTSKSSPKVTKFAPKKATTTSVTGVNKAGIAAGYYLDAQDVYHGFVRSAGGKLSIFDEPNAGSGNFQGTVVNGINDSGVVVGQYQDSNTVMHGFVRAANGTFTSFDAPKAATGPDQGTFAFAINAKGVVAGYFDKGKNIVGFVRGAGGAIKTFKVSGALLTEPRAINAAGEIAGVNLHKDGTYHGFLRATGGTIIPFDVNGATATEILGINASGAVTGLFEDSNRALHGFVLGGAGKVKKFDVPGAGSGSNQGTQSDCINDDGTVSGYYDDSTFVPHAFVRAADGTITKFSIAKSGAGGSRPKSINSAGEIVGSTGGDSSQDGAVGFVRAP